MSYLLKILPITLKTQLAKFLYQDAIQLHRFLQFREDNFYSKYLEELDPDHFKQGDIISKQGSEPSHVYFIMNGVVHNQTTNRYFERGQMINQQYIMLKTHILDQYVAHTDVSVLKFDKLTFNLILEQFQDFKEDLQEANNDRKTNMQNDQII